MGEIVEDMIEGLSCSWCGIYFTEPHGHSVVCKDCVKIDNHNIVKTTIDGIKMIGGMIIAYLPELSVETPSLRDEGEEDE